MVQCVASHAHSRDRMSCMSILSWREPPMTTIVAVNPFRCCMWPLHDRLEQHVDEGSCRVEIESVRKNGQLVPTLGRALQPNSEYDYELIYGARRLFIARHLNRQMLVDVRAMTDP